MSKQSQTGLPDLVLAHYSPEKPRIVETIQELWSGYGHLYRLQGKSQPPRTSILKHILLPDGVRHPRGWNTDLSHQRKVRSYEVEIHWYKNWVHRVWEVARMPEYLGSQSDQRSFVLHLEDLDAAGFPRRIGSPQGESVEAVIQWLARFHAHFLGAEPKGLWQEGCYWHLGTRPEEYQRMPQGPLKDASEDLDQALRQAKYRTILHGDAKIANFCFSTSGTEVAAVDFQYIGGGVGVKDLAYFVSSCYYEEECQALEEQILGTYFAALKQSVARWHPSVEFAKLEDSWRQLYPVAWADFSRFLQGWSPGHWKLHRYSRSMVQRALNQL
jgi:hypothetical protein